MPGEEQKSGRPSLLKNDIVVDQFSLRDAMRIMKPVFPVSSVLACAVTALLAMETASSKELEITAGTRAISQGVLFTEKPADLPADPVLQGPNGETIPLQEDAANRLSFILPALPAGQSVRFKLAQGTPAKEPAALTKIDGNTLCFSVSGKPVGSYQADTKDLKTPRPGLDPKFIRGGYLHPLITPSGKTVTDDYPANHLHHHGVWMAWTKAVYDGRETDFWNMGQGKGRVDFSALDKFWSGPVHAGLVAKNRYTDLTSGSPVVVLNEQWTVRIYAVANGEKPYHLIDLETEQNLAGNLPLGLPQYHYGGLGVRGPTNWDGATNASFLNSEGLTDRLKLNAQPARWMRMTGTVDGSAAGVAVLSHPDNFRSPQPVRVHPKEPFISFAPQTNGDMEIKPGETYRTRYRFVISDGDADAALLDELWQAFAEPPVVKWVD